MRPGLSCDLWRESLLHREEASVSGMPAPYDIAAPQGKWGAALAHPEVCVAVATDALLVSCSSSLTFWLPVGPGSVPEEARLSASPEAMPLSVTKNRSLHAANVTQREGPSVQKNSYPEAGPGTALTC